VPLETPANASLARFDDYPRAALGVLPVLGSEQYFPDRCGIESVIGNSSTLQQPDGSFIVDLPATLSGWAVVPDEISGIPEAWLRMVSLGPAAVAEQFPLVLHLSRPDVVAVVGTSRAAFSGFTSVVVDGLPPGTYHAQVVFASASGRWVCSNVRQVEVK